MNKLTTIEVTMTIKEIASLTGKGIGTVGEWIKKGINTKIVLINTEIVLTNQEIWFSIKEKMSKASSTYPARFNEKEVIEIVRAGGNETLANLLQKNITEQETAIVETSNNFTPELLQQMITSAVLVAVQQIQKPLQIEAPRKKERNYLSNVSDFFKENYNRVLNEVDEAEIAEHCFYECEKWANSHEENNYYNKLPDMDMSVVEFPRHILVTVFRKYVTAVPRGIKVDKCYR